MTDRPVVVEHWGTFEVANFGDLLYPVVLEHHLRQRAPGVELRLAGPIGGRAPMGVDRHVRRAVTVAEVGFWEQAEGVDAFVLGGGDLIHTWAGVVTVGGVPARLDQWAFAAESGLLGEARPFAWNALGVPFDLDATHAALLRTATEHVALLTVRDETSRQRLERAGIDREIRVVPDTGVLAPDVIDAVERATCLARLRAAGALPPEDAPFVAVHASFALPAAVAELAGALDQVRGSHPDLHFVLLELGHTHGDVTGLRDLQARLGDRASLVRQPNIADACAVLEASEAVVSSSYHAALVASALGVPTVGFMQDNHRPSKLVDLARQLGREPWLVDRPSVVTVALAAALRGEGAPDAERVKVLQAEATAHLEDVALVVTAGEPRTVDLTERGAAHRHVVDRLAMARDREDHATAERVQLLDQLRRARAAGRMWEAAYWRSAGPEGPGATEHVLDVNAVRSSTLEADPYRWGLVGPLFTPAVAGRLAATFPLDEAELRDGTDGRRSWRYRVRCLLPMGRSTPVRPHALDPLWRRLADDLSGSAYRDAVSAVTGVDVSSLHLEANLFSYGPGGYQEPHPDLPEKVVTHVLWFNEDWEATFGGCLRILRSKDPGDIDRELLPELGWSALFVRSATSWHSVTAMTDAAPAERRALVATFHRPGSVSSMWGEAPD